MRWPLRFQRFHGGHGRARHRARRGNLHTRMAYYRPSWTRNAAGQRRLCLSAAWYRHCCSIYILRHVVADRTRALGNSLKQRRTFLDLRQCKLFDLLTAPFRTSYYRVAGRKTPLCLPATCCHTGAAADGRTKHTRYFCYARRLDLRVIFGSSAATTTGDGRHFAASLCATLHTALYLFIPPSYTTSGNAPRIYNLCHTRCHFVHWRCAHARISYHATPPHSPPHRPHRAYPHLLNGRTAPRLYGISPSLPHHLSLCKAKKSNLHQYRQPPHTLPAPA